MKILNELPDTLQNGLYILLGKRQSGKTMKVINFCNINNFNNIVFTKYYLYMERYKGKIRNAQFRSTESDITEYRDVLNNLFIFEDIDAYNHFLNHEYNAEQCYQDLLHISQNNIIIMTISSFDQFRNNLVEKLYRTISKEYPEELL